MKRQRCCNCGKEMDYWGYNDVWCVECGDADEETFLANKYKYADEETIKKRKTEIANLNDGNIREKHTGCYIATICYGNENLPQVVILKNYRDDVLLKNIWGKLFVNIYYKISPKISVFLKNKDRLNHLIKYLILERIEKHIIIYYNKY